MKNAYQEEAFKKTNHREKSSTKKFDLSQLHLRSRLLLEIIGGKLSSFFLSQPLLNTETRNSLRSLFRFSFLLTFQPVHITFEKIAIGLLEFVDVSLMNLEIFVKTFKSNQFNLVI